MTMRALMIWFALLMVAVTNGVVREALFVPYLGDRLAHAVSSITLAAAIFFLTWLSIGWINPATTRNAWIVGMLWLTLTLAFEFVAGHYLFGTPWNRLLDDYNLMAGRLWVLVLIVTATAPGLLHIYKGG